MGGHFLMVVKVSQGHKILLDAEYLFIYTGEVSKFCFWGSTLDRNKLWNQILFIY